MIVIPQKKVSLAAEMNCPRSSNVSHFAKYLNSDSSSRQTEIRGTPAPPRPQKNPPPPPLPPPLLADAPAAARRRPFFPPLSDALNPPESRELKLFSRIS